MILNDDLSGNSLLDSGTDLLDYSSHSMIDHNLPSAMRLFSGPVPKGPRETDRSRCIRVVGTANSTATQHNDRASIDRPGRITYTCTHAGAAFQEICHELEPAMRWSHR